MMGILDEIFQPLLETYAEYTDIKVILEKAREQLVERIKKELLVKEIHGVDDSYGLGLKDAAFLLLGEQKK